MPNDYLTIMFIVKNGVLLLYFLCLKHTSPIGGSLIFILFIFLSQQRYDNQISKWKIKFNQIRNRFFKYLMRLIEFRCNPYFLEFEIILYFILRANLKEYYAGSTHSVNHFLVKIHIQIHTYDKCVHKIYVSSLFLAFAIFMLCLYCTVYTV